MKDKGEECGCGFEMPPASPGDHVVLLSRSHMQIVKRQEVGHKRLREKHRDRGESPGPHPL